MRLQTTEQQGGYLWHYFTDIKEAKEAALCGAPLKVSEGLWRVRVKELSK